MLSSSEPSKRQHKMVTYSPAPYNSFDVTEPVSKPIIVGYAYSFTINNGFDREISYDFTKLIKRAAVSPKELYTPASGTIHPARSASVRFDTPPDLIEYDKVPLLTVKNIGIDFWFWTKHGFLKDYQFINIIVGNGVIEITDTSKEQTIVVGDFTINLSATKKIYDTNRVEINIWHTDQPR